MQPPDGGTPGIIIREAAWPADEAVATTLLRNYETHLRRPHAGIESICLRGYDRELANLCTVWSLPSGVLLLAWVQGRPAGCVGIRMRTDNLRSACEMKRLWIEDHARGRGLGRSLAIAAIQHARSLGAAMLLLDTVPAVMPEALALYRALGFVETERHNNNDVAGLTFMKLDLFSDQNTA